MEEDIRQSFKILLSAAFLSSAHQIPRPLAGQTDTDDPWRVSAEFSLTDQSGNRQLRLLTGGLNATHLQRESFRFDAGFRSRYGRSEGELVALNHQGSLAFDLRPRSTWSPFVLFDAERDQFRRLGLRLSSGAGAKYTLHRAEEGPDEASISLALLHAYERIQRDATGDPEVDAAPLRTHTARWSLRARTTRQVREGVTFRHTTFYQPVWDQVADYLLRSDTSIRVLLTERLALSVEYQLKRDARPPEGVAPNDRLLTTGLIIDF
jgi:hypothetical protein